jgi:hypothetical protein
MQVAGVNYDVNWRQFRKGSSMFFPCLDPAMARKEVVEVTRRLGFDITTRTEINDGVRGLRVWRV